jgi:hypothetical protein
MGAGRRPRLATRAASKSEIRVPAVAKPLLPDDFAINDFAVIRSGSGQTAGWQNHCWQNHDEY